MVTKVLATEPDERRSRAVTARRLSTAEAGVAARLTSPATKAMTTARPSRGLGLRRDCSNKESSLSDGWPPLPVGHAENPGSGDLRCQRTAESGVKGVNARSRRGEADNCDHPHEMPIISACGLHRPTARGPSSSLIRCKMRPAVGSAGSSPVARRRSANAPSRSPSANFTMPRWT